MTCAIVAISRNEADIADLWVRHHLAEGIDHIYVSDDSTDGTKEILAAHPEITVLDSPDVGGVLYQAHLTNHLIGMAAKSGHAWILPTDLDEFTFSTDGRTINERLSDCGERKLYLEVYEHRNWSMRYLQHDHLQKVAFRCQPNVAVDMGNHEVNVGGGVYGILSMRELQFRSFEHFCRKIRERNATLPTELRALGHASHVTRFDNKTEEELRAEWEQKMELPTVVDPIPSHINAG